MGEKVTKETLMQKRDSRRQKRNKTTVNPKLTTGMLQFLHERNGYDLPQPKLEDSPESRVQERPEEDISI